MAVLLAVLITEVIVVAILTRKKYQELILDHQGHDAQGVILTISKHDQSSSMILARQIDGELTGYGPLFPLQNENGFIWQNRRVAAEELSVGSVVTYWIYNDFHCVYHMKDEIDKQSVTKIQQDLYSTEHIYPGISDAFQEAKIHSEGLAFDKMPNSGIAVIGMREAHIEDERLYLTTCRGEKFSVELLCRDHLKLSASPTKLHLRLPSHHLQDCAVLEIVKTKHSIRLPRYSTYSAVCVGLLLERRPAVISIKNEPVRVKDSDGKWMLVDGEVVFDTGNEVATGISEKLVRDLGLKPDRSTVVEIIVAGGAKVKCHGTVEFEVKVRDHIFRVTAVVGSPSLNTHILFGKDINKRLLDLGYTFGE